MCTGFRYAALLMFTGWKVCAQDAESESSGITFYERFQGSVNSLGAVNQLDTNVGYKFSPYLSVDGGLPVYFIRPSTSTASATGYSSSNGIGNIYGQLRLTLANAVLNFESTLTGAAPTGDQSTGFSTGNATVDWSNYFDHSFSRLTPFVNLGIANAVSDTAFFTRPYTTSGFVTHVEGGARYRLAHILSVGGSAYEIAPSGQQTVVSRLVKDQATAGSNRQNHGVFETGHLTTGSSDIAKDHGLSAWVQIQPARSLGFYAAYSRSTQYSLDTISFGVSLNLGTAIRFLGI